MTDKIHSHHSLTRNEPAVKKVGVSAAEIMPSPANCIRKTLFSVVTMEEKKILGFFYAQGSVITGQLEEF